jgi:colanic acid/amylovoran biosynthesis glycosyltransferase
MKVLFLTASYPVPEHPLLGIFVKEHARAVSPHCDLAVVHLDRNPATRGVPRLDDVADEEWPTIRARYPRSPAPLSYAANLAATAAGYRRLRNRGFVPDVIHAHFFLAGVPALALGRVLRKPVVVTEQWSTFLPDDPMTLSPLMQRVARATFTHADMVLPVSDALRDGIRSLGVSAEFRVVPNVVDVRQFHPGPQTDRNGRPQKLIGVGGLYHAKGWEFLLEAVALVARDRHDFTLDIVGDGELKGEHESLAGKLGIADLVTFHGWLPKADVAARVRDADLFVLTSRYDSNPCAVIEALASGVPVVGTAVGGIPDMVGEGMGLLAAAQDPESIAGQLRLALDRRGSWDRAAIARRAGARYGAEHVGATLAGIYEEVSARRR